MEFLQPYYTVIALILIAVVVLVGAAMIIRSFNGRVRGRRGSRLGISEYYEMDQTRRLVLIRRDDVEHLMDIRCGLRQRNPRKDHLVGGAVGIAAWFAHFEADELADVAPPVTIGGHDQTERAFGLSERLAIGFVGDEDRLVAEIDVDLAPRDDRLIAIRTRRDDEGAEFVILDIGVQVDLRTIQQIAQEDARVIGLDGVLAV